MPKKLEKGKSVVGQQYAEWTVLEEPFHKNGRWFVLCRCSCGKEKVVNESNLVMSLSTRCKSCSISNHRRSHGQSRDGIYHIYRIWKAMKWRCNTRNKRTESAYWGRGITVCDEWVASFEAFRDWSLANGYARDLTIDRIDNDAGYSPANCRWVTVAQQALNTRQNRYLTIFNETKTVKEWVDDPRCAVRNQAFRERIRSGWPPEEALTRPDSTFGPRRPKSCSGRPPEGGQTPRWPEGERT